MTGACGRARPHRRSSAWGTAVGSATARDRRHDDVAADGVTNCSKHARAPLIVPHVEYFVDAVDASAKCIFAGRISLVFCRAKVDSGKILA
jgi:hypothetical protein